MKLEALAAGLGAGVLVGALTRIVETPRIAFGPYALDGNGALAIPVILAPLVVFAGWLWLTRRTRWLSPETVVYAVGLVLGSGMGYGAAMSSAARRPVPRSGSVSSSSPRRSSPRRRARSCARGS
ncbi:MAG: hypothetical protein FJ028_03540 [Chloroflexi bacterium]|nr:hypothetical protein [Chloroflexota bacterium]